MTDTITTNGKTQTTDASKAKRKRERKLQTLIAHGQQQRQTLKLTGSVSPNGQEVASTKFPLHTPFVTSPESTELFTKLSKHEVVSLFSQQRYSSAGIVGYLINLS